MARLCLGHLVVIPGCPESLERRMQPEVGTGTQDSWAWGDISPKERADIERRAKNGLEHVTLLLKEPATETEQERREEGDQEPRHLTFPVSPQLSHFSQ